MQRVSVVIMGISLASVEGLEMFGVARQLQVVPWVRPAGQDGN